MLDTVISVMRPVTLRGKGFVFDYVTPRKGIRHATVAGSYVMTLDLENAIHRQIYMGCFANAMTRWARTLLNAGGTFLDVGAHVGYFSLIAADRVGREGRVFAMEPNPVVFRRSVRTWRPIKSRTSTPATGAWQSGKDPSSCTCLTQRVSATTMRPCFDGRTGRPSRYRCIVSTIAWTAWKVTRIDLMKIDVEGSEPRVLAGGAKHLARGVVRHAMIEINGPRLVEAGSSPAALVDDLAALGFEPARLVRGRAVRVSRADIDLDPDTNGIASSCTGRPWASTPGVTA